MIHKTDFFYFDKTGSLCIPSFRLTVARGEAVAILCTRGNHIGNIYQAFNAVNPLNKKTPSQPVIRCVTTNNMNLFSQFSAYENFSMAEHSVIQYSYKQMVRVCEELKSRFDIPINFQTPLKHLSISEQIIVQIVRAFISEMDILVCDNLISVLTMEDCRILLALFHAMLDSGKSILYLTTKWENAVQVASRIIATNDKEFMGEMSTREVIENPQHLLFLISGRTLMEQNAQSIDSLGILDMLHAGAKYLTNNYELSEALSVIINNVAHVMHCACCTICLRNQDSDIVHTYFGKYHDAPSFTDEFLRDYISGKTSFPEHIVYVTTEDINFHKIIADQPHKIKSAIAMPILGKNTVLGLLNVFFSNIVLYDNLQFNYLKSFCREVSVVVETSRLISNSVLLQESNHRIKNNLQIIISLIAMQQVYIRQNPETDIEQILDSIAGSVQNIASLHDLLTGHASHSNAISLHRIIECILRLYETTDTVISVSADDLLIPYAKATSISMIINELLANSVRHAFPHADPDRPKKVDLSCHIVDEVIIMELCDNGIGFPDSVDINTCQSIGFSILRSIIKSELHGTLKAVNTGHGTSVTVAIPYLALLIMT